jgi:hypothetical protein
MHGHQMILNFILGSPSLTRTPQILPIQWDSPNDLIVFQAVTHVLD